MKINPPKYLEEKILNHVMADLDPPTLVVHTKLALATMCGGLLSLIVCGQFGISLTNFADVFTHRVHELMGPIKCALLCGALFSIFPVSVLRLFLCHPLQFKVIAKKWRFSLTSWFLGFGLILAFFGHHGTGFLNIIAWGSAAMACTHLITYIFTHLIPQLDLRAIFGLPSA